MLRTCGAKVFNVCLQQSSRLIGMKGSVLSIRVIQISSINLCVLDFENAQTNVVAYNFLLLRTFWRCNHENNVSSRFSPQWLYGNLCTWACDNRISCAQVHELPQSYCNDNQYVEIQPKLFLRMPFRLLYNITAQKMKFSIKDFLSKCDQIRIYLRLNASSTLLRCMHFHY